ncbi:hypothetical protein JTB14_015460 [Gonioctena quinquepunctata]|nr:hypothetical protein JTB14_015460 [Gonioctena quinquepunctata]
MEHHDSGWMTVETFSIWFDHFVHHIEPTVQDPALLILDGHGSHTKNLKVIEKEHMLLFCAYPPHIAQTTARAYLKGCTSENAINAFKKAGIVPFNRNVFTDLDFAPAEVSEKDGSVPNVAEHIPRMDANTAQPTPGTSRDVQSHPIPRTDATGDNNVADDIQVGPVDAITNLPFNISAIDIRPLPKTTSMKKTNRQKGKTAILTSSPYRKKRKTRNKKT